jgi:hypothetical protein
LLAMSEKFLIGELNDQPHYLRKRGALQGLLHNILGWEPSQLIYPEGFKQEQAHLELRKAINKKVASHRSPLIPVWPGSNNLFVSMHSGKLSYYKPAKELKDDGTERNYAERTEQPPFIPWSEKNLRKELGRVSLKNPDIMRREMPKSYIASVAPNGLMLLMGDYLLKHDDNKKIRHTDLWVATVLEEAAGSTVMAFRVMSVFGSPFQLWDVYQAESTKNKTPAKDFMDYVDSSHYSHYSDNRANAAFNLEIGSTISTSDAKGFTDLVMASTLAIEPGAA